MLYVRKPTTEEMQELQRMKRQAVGRVSQRAQIVLLSVQRQSVPAIATLFQTSCVTIRFWLKRFNKDGPPGLYDQARSGRPRKVNQQAEETILGCIDTDPLTEGSLATFCQWVCVNTTQDRFFRLLVS